MEEFSRFAEHYGVLALLLVFGLVSLLWFRGNQVMQQIVIWSISGAYIFWGIGHHYLRRNLTATVVLEYFLISLIGGLVAQSVLLLR